MNGPDADLTALAEAYGVVTRYDDWRGEPVQVPRDTLVAVLGALGVDASTPQAARHALDEARLAPRRRALPPVVVTSAGRPASFRVHVTRGEPFDVWVELEDGRVRRDLRRLAVWVEPVVLDGVVVDEAPLQTPEDLPLGWHRIHARCGDREATAPLVVTPERLETPESLREGRAWGLTLQLYALRSRRSWGMGDLADLAGLASFSGRELGAGLVLVNPLHAAAPVPPIEPSPYFPASRRFANPLYLRVEDIPELAGLAPEDRKRVDALADPLRERDRTVELLDRDAVWEAKRAALELVYAVPREPDREAALQAFVDGEGDALRDFATWCALAERHGLPWRRWPKELRDPRAPAVARARAELAGRVGFHCWLQWLLDEQLAAAQRAARAAGMPVGVVHDLAVGVDPDGADAWAFRDVFGQGVTVGAPPDDFNQRGQDWRQPPWRPDRLAEAGYAPYRDMLRFAFRHAGGVRVDHILGLFRIWWVPDGAPPSAGTYVRLDHEALVGILALEAHRAGALVVGEDLGTVEPWVHDYLAERGLFGTSMLWFERDREGRPRPPGQWRELCLATVGTHDMPPIAGYLVGEHIALRQRLGLLTRPAAEEWAADEAGRRAWLEALRDLGLLEREEGVGPRQGAGTSREGVGLRQGAGTSRAGEWETTEALYAFLARTPARLIGVELADAVGERRPQNQPGTTDEYPNWRLPLTDGVGAPVSLEELGGDPVTSGRLRALARAATGR